MTELREDTATRRSVFERLAGWSYRHRWGALLVWVAVLIGVTVGAQAVGSDYRNDFSLPGTESQEAYDTLQEQGVAQANDTIEVVLQHPDGLATPGTTERVEAMLAELRQQPDVLDVRSPYEDESAIAQDGTIGYATVTLDGRGGDVPTDHVQQMIDTAQAAEGGGLRVELAGEAVRAATEEEGPPAELLGLVAALVILVFMFGSLLAASIPLVIAIFAVGGALGLVTLASHLATVADFTPYVMMLVGLGVGIDYALLVFARYRGELVSALSGAAEIPAGSGAGQNRGAGAKATDLVSGADRAQATSTALDTAGRTVFLAGTIVIIALMGLVLLGLGALQGVAVAVALTVLMTMLASLTLLPSLLAIFGRRIERRVQRRLQRRPDRDGAGWRRWVGLVQRRPWLAALLPAAALLVLAVPALDMRLGFADAGNDDPSTTSRQAYDLLAEGFGPGFNGPLLVVVEGDQAAVDALTGTLPGTEGVAEAFPTGPPADGVATMIVIPESEPQAAQTTELVERLRGEVLPPLADQTGARFLIGGSTAAEVDFSDVVAERLPLFVAVVVGLSALLLVVVFRSVLIPLKAAVLNLLSIDASLGVITLVFQQGWLGSLIGVEPGPVEAFVPIMIFAIIFGLSMDYEIFLLARMHEEWERLRAPRPGPASTPAERADAAAKDEAAAPAAIRSGIATTARVVTAAAAIMIVVFGVFMVSPDRMLKQFGLGLAVAIFLDAVVIRCLILPALMQLFGRRAWWLPRWLARRLPRVALEHT